MGILHRAVGLVLCPLPGEHVETSFRRVSNGEHLCPIRSAGVLPCSIPIIHAASSGSVNNIMSIHINYVDYEFDTVIIIILNLTIRNDQHSHMGGHMKSYEL